MIQRVLRSKTQARRAAARNMAATNTCKLCDSAVGTLQHLFECDATRPPDGWPVAPALANLATRTIGADRLRILKLHARLVLRVPAPIRSDDGAFRWLQQRPGFEDTEEDPFCAIANHCPCGPCIAFMCGCSAFLQCLVALN